MYTNNPHEKYNVDYRWKKAQTSLDMHQIYTWIGTAIIYVKNTHGKHLKQNQVAFFTWYPSNIWVNGYTINPRETIHVEYTWKCTPIIHMRNAMWITREKIRFKLDFISMCKSTPIIHKKKSTTMITITGHNFLSITIIIMITRFQKVWLRLWLWLRCNRLQIVIDDYDYNRPQPWFPVPLWLAFITKMKNIYFKIL